MARWCHAVITRCARLIFCVLIKFPIANSCKAPAWTRFEHDTTRVIEVMHFALNPGGYMFLGASESIEGSLDLFSVVDKEHHIYQGRPVPTRVAICTIPLSR